VPLRGRISFVLGLPGGSLGTLTLLWQTRARWRARPEAATGDWCAWEIGPFIVAARLAW
jgi:hypothetical protein